MSGAARAGERERQGSAARARMLQMKSGMTTNGFRLYLRLNDVVTHRDYREWGEGTVVEEMTSTVPGGTCLVRIQFQDGRQRTFQNDLDNPTCCYFFGIRKFWMPESMLDAPRTRRAATPRPAALAAPRRKARRRQT